MNDIKIGSVIEYRRAGGTKKTGRVEWVYIDAYTKLPYYRVRPDVGKRTEVHPADIERAATPYRQRPGRKKLDPVCGASTENTPC